MTGKEIHSLKDTVGILFTIIRTLEATDTKARTNCIFIWHFSETMWGIAMTHSFHLNFIVPLEVCLHFQVMSVFSF